jgi:hypothetical protein
VPLKYPKASAGVVRKMLANRPNGMAFPKNMLKRLKCSLSRDLGLDDRAHYEAMLVYETTEMRNIFGNSHGLYIWSLPSWRPVTL